MGFRAHSETPGTKLCQVAGLSVGPPRRAGLIRRAEKCYSTAARAKEVDRWNRCVRSSSHEPGLWVVFYALFDFSCRPLFWCLKFARGSQRRKGWWKRLWEEFWRFFMCLTLQGDQGCGCVVHPEKERVLIVGLQVQAGGSSDFDDTNNSNYNEGTIANFYSPMLVKVLFCNKTKWRCCCCHCRRCLNGRIIDCADQ